MSIERIHIRGEEHEFKSFLATANGQKIHCVEGGQGPLVLMVHGFPECWYVWRFQMAELIKNGFRVVAISPRGFGRSSKPREMLEYRITELAKDLKCLVKALGEEKAYLVGHDWGATTAWTAAWLYPEAFKGIVGISNCFDGCNVSALPFSPNNDKSASQAWAEFGNEERMFYQEYFANVELAETELNNDVRAWLFNAFFGWSGLPTLPAPLEGVDRLHMTDEEMKTVLRKTSIFRNRANPVNKMPMIPVKQMPEWMNDEDLDYIANWYAASGFYGGLNYYKAMDLSWEGLRWKEERITIPCLYLGGDRDWVALWSRDALERLPSRCDDLRGMKIFENAGHWQQLERADEVGAEILKFLESVEK